MRKPLLAIAAVTVVLIALGAYASTRLEPWILSKYPAGNWQPDGLAYQDVSFRAEDGVILHGWYVPHESPKAVLLYAHGTVGNVTTRAPTLKKLHDHGLAVMIFDYRGYGKSEGLPTEEGLYLDGKAARTWLAQTSNLPENQVVLLGHSLGSYVVVEMAASRGARGVILSSTGTSLQDFLSYNWWFPSRLFAGFAFDNTPRIGSYEGPLLMRHGDGDHVAPLAHAQQLFDSANEPKRLLIDHGGHDDFTDEFWAALDGFVDQLNAPAP